MINKDKAIGFRSPGQVISRANLPKKRARELCFSNRISTILSKEWNSRTMRPKKVILLVDDNEQDLSVLKFMLATNGYRVVSAPNGQQAISVFAENQVDLVLADYAMPQMNGNQLVGRLKQMASHVPMILLGDPQKMAGEMHVADALLAKKSCSSQELLERIKVMRRSQARPAQGHAAVGAHHRAGRGLVAAGRGGRARRSGALTLSIYTARCEEG